MRVFRGAAVAALLLVMLETSRAATLFPFLRPVRAEITNQIAFRTSGGSSNAADLRLLTQARNLIDRRRGRATLSGDLQILSTVATLLSRTSSRIEFEPLLQDSAISYLEVLTSTATNLQVTLSNLPPSASLDAAQNTVDSVVVSLEQAAAAPSALAASRALSRAAVRLLAVEALATRLTRERNRPEEMSAFIGGTLFRAGANTSAFFNPATGVLTISGTQNSGFESRSMTLSVSDVQAGTSTHTLGSPTTGDFASLSIRGTNSVGYASSSGLAFVTVDVVGRTVRGTFSFSGSSSSPFASPIQVSGGSFFARIDNQFPSSVPQPALP